VNIDNASIPTIVNGVTASTSITVGFGAATIGLAFRFDKENEDAKTRKTYYLSIAMFLLPLVYPLGSYMALTSNEFSFALKYSFDGFLVALWAIVAVFTIIGKSWKIDEPTENKTESTNQPLSHEQVRIAILTILYKKAEKSPNDYVVPRKEIIETLNLPENIIDFNLAYLRGEELIDLRFPFVGHAHNLAAINTSGINVIENKDDNRKRFPFLNATIPVQIETKIGLLNVSIKS
jgi:hypothetical protein